MQCHSAPPLQSDASFSYHSHASTINSPLSSQPLWSIAFCTPISPPLPSHPPLSIASDAPLLSDPSLRSGCSLPPTF